MSSNPYSPPGESSSDLWFERSNLVGAVLGGVAYGVHLAVFTNCVYRIAPWPGRSQTRIAGNTTRAWFLSGYVFLLFLMGTIGVACNTKMTDLMFIDNRAYPGGPNAWFFANYDNPNNTAGNAAYIIANFLADGLLLWRTYITWGSLWIIAFPSLVFLASTAMSIMTLFQSSRPDASLWTTTTVQFSLPYFSISIGLNVMLTLLLVVRLVYMSYKAKHTIGDEYGRAYISIAAMLLESATPYAVAGLIFIITYARNSDVQNLVLPALSQIMCISPEVIILRVALGRAVDSRQSATTTATVSFSRRGEGVVRAFPTISDDAALKDGDYTMTSGSTAMESRPDLVKGDV